MWEWALRPIIGRPPLLPKETPMLTVLLIAAAGTLLPMLSLWIADQHGRSAFA